MDPLKKWINDIFGILPSWELGEEDNRLAEQDVNSKRWNRLLNIAGFERIDLVAYGYLFNNVTARPARGEKKSRNGSPSCTRATCRTLPNKSFSSFASEVMS